MKKKFLPTAMGTAKNRNAEIDTAPSVLTADVVVEGNLICRGDIHLEGRINGNINANSLRLVPGAYVKGALQCVSTTISADSTIDGDINISVLRIEGSVNGSIVADTIHISESAVVSGDISYQQISIDTGAQIEGSITRQKTQPVPVAAISDKKAKSEQPLISKDAK